MAEGGHYAQLFEMQSQAWLEENRPEAFQKNSRHLPAVLMGEVTPWPCWATSLGSRGGKSSLKKVSASSICALRCFWMKLSKSRRSLGSFKRLVVEYVGGIEVVGSGCRRIRRWHRRR